MLSYKALDSYNTFISGWVHSVKAAKIKENVIVVGKVTHSFRVNEADLKPWIVFNQSSQILACHCNCMAGLGESCSHVAALLFFCEFMATKSSTTTVTDQPAYWINPNAAKKVRISPKKSVEICYRNAKNMYSNPTIKTKKVVKVNTKYFPPPMNNQAEMVKFLERVKQSNANCALLRVVQPFCNVSNPKNKFPFVLTDLYCPANEMKSLQELQIMGSKLVFNLKDEDLAYIELNSREQSRSKNWRAFRAGRITASVAHRVCRVRSANSSPSLIRNICHPSATQIRKKSILWGCEHEKDAFATYININTPCHTNLQVTRCGLFLHKRLQVIAASPDGIVHCDCCGDGVLELKCPLCLIDDDDFSHVKYLHDDMNTATLKLIQNHPYYYQIQTQLLCTATNYADFFIWGPNGKHHQERIFQNDTICKEIISSSLYFFRDALAPELLALYYTRKKSDVCVDKNSNAASI